MLYPEVVRFERIGVPLFYSRLNTHYLYLILKLEYWVNPVVRYFAGVDLGLEDGTSMWSSFRLLAPHSPPASNRL